MPAIAAVGAVAAIGIAGASVADVGLTVGSAFAIAGAVGATASAIGTVTGNKTLQIAGGALGAVGGIGAGAASAGLFGADQGLFSTAAAAAPDAAGGGGSLGPSGAGELGLSASGRAPSDFGQTADALSSVAGTAPPSGVLPVSSGTTGLDASGQPLAGSAAAPNAYGQGDSTVPTGPGGIIGGSGSPTPANTAGARAGVAPGVAPPSPPATPGSASAASPYGTTTGGPPVTGPYTTTTPAGAFPTSSTGLINGTAPAVTVPDAGGTGGSWAKILDAIESKPTLALAGVSAVGSFLQGAFNPTTGAQVNALNAQATANTAAAARTTQQTANASQPIPGATRTRTNVGTSGRNQGLINGG